MNKNTRQNEMDTPFFVPKPTAERPLAGLTILAVEDSRFASEALRLMCLRSGGRIRRADCLASAHRHLNTYRPSVAIVDLGLPDGSGLSLIEEMSRAPSRVPVILATSGADRKDAEAAALASGADGFLPKPVESLGHFQTEILKHLPDMMRPPGVRPLELTLMKPDELALREDLTHALRLLEQEATPVGYLRRFLLGIARSAHDPRLLDRVRTLPETLAGKDRRELADLLKSRVARMAAV